MGRSKNGGTAVMRLFRLGGTTRVASVARRDASTLTTAAPAEVTSGQSCDPVVTLGRALNDVSALSFRVAQSVVDASYFG